MEQAIVKEQTGFTYEAFGVHWARCEIEHEALANAVTQGFPCCLSFCLSQLN
jgi:hypothetical protein